MIHYKMRSAARRLMDRYAPRCAESLGDWPGDLDYDPVVMETAVGVVLNPDTERIETEDPRYPAAVALREALEASPEYGDLTRTPWLIQPTLAAVESISGTLRGLLRDHPEEDLPELLRSEYGRRKVAAVVQRVSETSRNVRGLLAATGMTEGAYDPVAVHETTAALLRRLPPGFVDRLGAAMKALASRLHPTRADGAFFAGYRRSQDLHEVETEELARLGSPCAVTRALAVAEWWGSGLVAERRAGRSTARGGHFTVYLDESGSMSGERYATVAPVVGAALITAKKKGLTPRLFSFHSAVFDPVPLDPSKTLEHRWLEALSTCRGGTTSYVNVLRHALGLPEGSAVWVVGDGGAYKPEQAALLSARLADKCKVSFLGILPPTKRHGVREMMKSAHQVSFVSPSALSQSPEAVVASLADALKESLT